MEKKERFWIYQYQKVDGPYEKAEIAARVNRGELSRDAKVCKADERFEWKSIDDAFGDLFTLPPLAPLSAVKSTGPTEFRRTCRVCGKVWHSLESREVEIEKKVSDQALLQAANGMAGCGTCGLTLGAAAQHQQARESFEAELLRLRSCPDCMSASYDEQRIGVGSVSRR